QPGCNIPRYSLATAWAAGGISRSLSLPAATCVGLKTGWSLPWSRTSIIGTSRICSLSASKVPNSFPINSTRTSFSPAGESAAQADGRVSNSLCRCHEVCQEYAFVGGWPFFVDTNVSRAILNRRDTKLLLDDIAIANIPEPSIGADVALLT